jgi:hypothetical protein
MREVVNVDTQASCNFKSPLVATNTISFDLVWFT